MNSKSVSSTPGQQSNKNTAHNIAPHFLKSSCLFHPAMSNNVNITTIKNKLIKQVN